MAETGLRRGEDPASRLDELDPGPWRFSFQAVHRHDDRRPARLTPLGLD